MLKEYQYCSFILQNTRHHYLSYHELYQKIVVSCVSQQC